MGDPNGHVEQQAGQGQQDGHAHREKCVKAEPFLRPRLTGPRFEGHAIPLEFLKDLAVLPELITEVAKWEFFKENPSRKRSPRGFTEGIELTLAGLEDGSVVPVIKLAVATTPMLCGPPSQMYFERARDDFVGAVAAAAARQSPTEYLPEEALGYFDRLGRSLRDNEAIEFTIPSRSSPPAKLTKEIRRRLVLASSKVRELTEEISVRGAVPEADQDKMTFEVQLMDGRKIKAPIAAQHYDTVKEAWNSYREGARVWLKGVGRFNRSERLQGFESIEHISILDPLDILARLEELSALPDGWLEGRGQAPPQAGLDWLGRAFDRYYPEDLPLPYLYPTEEGGVQAEWTLGPQETTLEIDLSTHRGQWHRLNLDTDEDEVKDLDLDDTEAWSWVAEQLQHMERGS